jgi:hypothetical protein
MSIVFFLNAFYFLIKAAFTDNKDNWDNGVAKVAYLSFMVANLIAGLYAGGWLVHG